jgi:hypothetical protein
MEDTKETSPLLDKSKSPEKGKEQPEEESPQPSTSTAPSVTVTPSTSLKKGQKTKSTSSLIKPNLPVVTEVGPESEEVKAGDGEGKRKGVEGLEKKRTCPHCVAETQAAVQQAHQQMSYFGVRSYLHQFYEASSPLTPNPPVSFKTKIRSSKSTQNDSHQIGIYISNWIYLRIGPKYYPH